MYQENLIINFYKLQLIILLTTKKFLIKISHIYYKEQLNKNDYIETMVRFPKFDKKTKILIDNFYGGR